MQEDTSQISDLAEDMVEDLDFESDHNDVTPMNKTRNDSFLIKLCSKENPILGKVHEDGLML